MIFAKRRIARAKELLRDRGRTIADSLSDVGFKDMTHFGRVFKKLDGQLPSEFRRHLGGGPQLPGLPGSADPST